MNHDNFKPAHRPLDFLSLLLMALLFVAGSQQASAQVAASISGRVEDPSGAAIQGTIVTVTSLETGTVRTATADEGGNYRVLSLPVGQYEVKAEKTGFKAVVQKGINLVVGQEAVVNLNLEVGQMQQSITVTAEAQVVNTTTASISGLVAEEQVKDLPLNGRSIDNLITLNTGAVNFSTNAGNGGNTGPRNYFSVAGRREEQTVYLLNGVEMTGVGIQISEPIFASGEMLGIDAVREFNVLTDSYSAEYGKRPGAQVSIVSQSGTNQLHGSVFEFLRNSALDARNYFDQGPIPPFRRNQFGGALGGPIQKDKTFIFGNYEGFRSFLAVSNLAFVPDANARQGLLPNAKGVETPVAGLAPRMLPFMALWPQPNGPDLGSGVAESFNHPLQTIREDYGTVRLDHNFSDKDSVSENYTIDDGLNITPLSDPLYHFIWPIRNQIFSLQEQHIFSPQTINTVRVGFARSHGAPDDPPVTAFPASLDFVAGFYPGAVSIGGVSGAVAAGGTLTPAGGSTVESLVTRNQFTYSDDFQRIYGKHQINLGAWFQNVQENRLAASYRAGNTSFSTLTTFLQGTVSNFAGVVNATEAGYRMFMGAWYVEDNIALSPNLTLRIGLRHEFDNGWNAVNGHESNYIPGPNGVLETNPLVGQLLTENNAKWLFNPRAGLAWNVFGNGKTSVRVAGGIYHQLQDDLGYMPDNTRPFNANVTFGQNVSFASLVPIQPATVALSPACGPGVPSPCTIFAPNGVQPNMKIPTVDEWNLTIEQQITPNTAFRAAYVGSHSSHLLDVMDPNSIPSQICSNPSGCVSGGVNKTTGLVPQGAQYIPVGTRPNPYLSNAYIWNSVGTASYNALQLDLTHRFSQGLQFRTNYTWSKNMDEGELSAGISANGPNGVLDPYDIRRDWGPSTLDATHQGSISGSYELPFGRGKPWMSAVSGAGDKLVSGWQVNGIFSLLSGYPFTALVGSNQSGNGNSKNPDRPSLNPAFSGAIIEGTPNQWFNPNAFLLPVSGTYGNVGRDSLRGPGLRQLDLSLFKTTAMTERLKVEFRAEFFNSLNHSNFSHPNISVFSGGVISPTAGLITATATTSRQIQFGLKLIF